MEPKNQDSMQNNNDFATIPESVRSRELEKSRTLKEKLDAKTNRLEKRYSKKIKKHDDRVSRINNFENGTLPENEKAPISSENQIPYSKKEEWINRITHLVGAGLAVIASIILICKAVYLGMNGREITAVCIYAFALILMYTMSTLYHWMPIGYRRRSVFRRFDHCSVAILIAGTYAPYMLIEVYRVNVVWAIILASVVFLMALLTVIFNSIDVNKFKVFSHIAYVVMGWACIMRIDLLFRNLPNFIFLIVGGLFFTFGILYYANKKWKLNHAIWHFFVLAGTVMHYLGILLYVVV